ncbi:unnamed protein product [Oikopleura dioica]|uniref:Protein kinase domain-containing protein n=1 Tax=Oikopleura dioica TaxID=34765 RepID=E4YUS9_OIKDI|nr:unnamed protein product [Oikopleura dioica]
MCPDQTYLWENRIECLDVCGTEFIEPSSTFGFMMISNNQAHELSCPWQINSSCKIIELQLMSVVDRYNCAWDFWQVDGDKFCIEENLPLWISGKSAQLHLEASSMPNMFSVRWKCRGHFLEGEKCDFLWIDFLKRFSVISDGAESVEHGDVFKLGSLSFSILTILKSKTEAEFDTIQKELSKFFDDLESKSFKEILNDNHLLARAGSFARSMFEENIPELVHLMTVPLILLQFNVTSLFLEEEITNEEIITSWIKIIESMSCSSFQYCPELKKIFESLFVDDFMAKNFPQFANVEKSQEAVFYLVGTLSIFAVIPAFVVTQKVRKKLNDSSENQHLREIFVPLKQLKLDSSNCELIGEGFYGRIIKTKLNDQEVCVKEVTGKSDAEVQRSILEQAHFLSKLEHENVMGLSNLSWSSDGMPLIIMPLMSRGSLLSFIQHEITEAPLTTTLIIRFARDLCRGMEYLSGKHIIHRDLAARNCLLDSNLNIKISDFGLSRISKSAVEESEVEYIIKSHDLALPLRWVAPEALKNGRFSVMSDVWSFGVLFWEMLSRGIRPYTELRNEGIIGFLDKGERLQRPSYWQDDEVWKILLRTWHMNPDGR